MTDNNLIKKLWQRPSTIIVTLLFLFLLVVPKIVTGYYLHAVILIIMYATLGTAWNWIGGFAGQMSLGNAVYFGLGAYATACSQLWWGWNPWLGLLLGIVLSGIVAFLIGLPCFRLKGHYFAIATMAVGEIVNIIFTNWDAAGGASGLYLTIKESSLLNFQFASKVPYFYIVLVLLVLATAITIWLKNSRSGYYFRAIKEDPEAAKALGINLVNRKLMAIILSGTVSSVAGSFWINYMLFIDPPSAFLIMTSVQIALIAVMGGMGTVWGPIVGASIIIPLSEGSRMFLGGTGSGIDLVIYGLLIMLVAIYQPGGIVGAVNNYTKKRQSKKKATLKAVQEVSE
ncbi:MAG: branched-chain amino acid ABC transporter permease [Clostridia bacterium]|jgi:branched-chain amino acid transport system permease protein|nr:branched-chain amino acid ABC transporter permease [Clostridia bacterium]